MKTKILKILFLNFFISSCATSPNKNLYKKMAYNFKPNTNFEKELTQKEVNEDIDLIKKVTKRAYSGSKFLPNNEYSKFVSDIEAIRAPITAIDFCDKIGLAMEKVSDNHFNVRIKDKDWKNNFCGSPDKKKKMVDVGKNFFDGIKKPWAVKYDTVRGKKVLKISITAFLSRKSPKWNGFLEMVKKYKDKTDFIILDMRGNGGGDDSKGGDLAELLAGNKIEHPYEDQFTWRTPEAYQLLINSMEASRRYYVKKGETVPGHFAELSKEFKADQKKVLAGKFPEGYEYRKLNLDSETFDPKKAVKVPIYILMNKSCGSSCESTIDFFEYLPSVKKVGTHTAGYIHFGNNGYLVTPNAGLMLQMATSFNKYKDGRFIEKIGIKPDIEIKSKKDAMNVAIDDFFKKPPGF